jgi:hypothetical protein
MRRRPLYLALSFLVVLPFLGGGLGCGSSHEASHGASGSSSTSPTGSTKPPPTSGASGSSGVNAGGGQPPPVSDAMAPDTTIGQVSADSGLPDLPTLTNVVATQREDSVGIDFDPVTDAVDYRVYPLPALGTATINADGSLTIPNAIYRCAGMRQGYDLQNNLESDAGDLTVFNPPWNWQSSVSNNPLLGYVYPEAGPGLVPVYAVAGYPMQVELGWRESRLKVYTTDATERQTLLAQDWRDDGIVFYVPSAASSSTQTVYTSANAVPWNCTQCNSTQNTQSYYLAASMSEHKMDATPPAAAFQVLTSAAAGTVPLQVVTYTTDQVHDELTVGTERYKRALYQGDGPTWHLEWAGLTQPTTLVVEALKTGCPFQGFLSAQHLEAPPHQTFYTLADLQAASPTGEVFINGEYDNVTASPVPIARSFVNVTPQPHNQADWDWYQGFNQGTDLGPVTQLDFQGSQTDYSCTWEGCMSQDSVFQIAAYELDYPNNVAVLTWGQFMGQLWEAFDDTGQDVTGRLRFSALQTATVASSTYLHVTMSVNTVSSTRRYPQFIVSDQPLPVDCTQTFCGGGNGIGNANSNSIIVQVFDGPAMQLEAEAFHGLVDGAPWNVNNQAPSHDFVDSDPNGSLTDPQFAALSPVADPPFEHAGMDRMTKIDAFISTQRMYVFMDGQPAGCSQYPSDFNMAPGMVTVTFGDVLYHELAPDEVCGDPRMFQFGNKHQCTETSRHFDDLGFKSGVAAPASGSPAVLGGASFTWDETRLPCAPY